MNSLRSLIKIIFIFVFISTAYGFNESVATSSLFINFKNLEKRSGYIEVTIYSCKKDFLKKGKGWKKKRIKVDGNGDAKAVFDNIPFGTYAAVGYHDVNSNGKFDRNFIGLPKEPYAFSKKFNKKTRKPKFKEVHFDFKQPNQTIVMGFQKY